MTARPTATVDLLPFAVEALGAAPTAKPAPAATHPVTPAPRAVDPATTAERLADEHATALLPDSSVPAAYDRGHLYSPTAEIVAYGISWRPGTEHEPMPDAPRGNPKAWVEWWRTIATTPTADYLSLRVGDEITIQHVTCTGLGTVISTCRFGAVVRYPPPEGVNEPDTEMYVRCRNHLGHWYR